MSDHWHRCGACGEYTSAGVKWRINCERVLRGGFRAITTEKANKPCMCKLGDPCDYHAATCTTCGPEGCQGHPSKEVTT